MKYFKNYVLFTEMLKKDVNKKYDFGCVMLFFNIPKIKNIINVIEDDDVYCKEGFGVETKSHVTLLYGLHDNEIEDDSVMDMLLKYEYYDLYLTNPSLFINNDCDVLKFDVVCKDNENFLFDINNELKNEFPYTSDYPNYHPHCTIAYLKSGSGQKYVDILKDIEVVVHPSKLVYSKSNGEKIVKKID